MPCPSEGFYIVPVSTDHGGCKRGFIAGVGVPSSDRTVRGGGDDCLVEVAEDHVVDPVGMGLGRLPECSGRLDSSVIVPILCRC